MVVVLVDLLFSFKDDYVFIISSHRFVLRLI